MLPIWKSHPKEAGEGAGHLGVSVLRTTERASDDESPASSAQSKSSRPKLSHKRQWKLFSSNSTLKLHSSAWPRLRSAQYVTVTLQEEMPERYSTSKSYRSNIKNHLKPRWGDYLLDQIRPMAVEDWLKNLPMAPKSKTHIRSVMHLMFECATRWELFTERRNPIALVRVKGGSKRRQRPTILTVDQFETIVATAERAVSHDGLYRPMPRSSRERDRGASVGRLRFREESASRSAQLRERASG